MSRGFTLIEGVIVLVIIITLGVLIATSGCCGGLGSRCERRKADIEAMELCLSSPGCGASGQEVAEHLRLKRLYARDCALEPPDNMLEESPL